MVSFGIPATENLGSVSRDLSSVSVCLSISKIFMKSVI